MTTADDDASHGSNDQLSFITLGAAARIDKRDLFQLKPSIAALLFVVALVGSLVPFFGRDIPSLGDLENHLVRGWVLEHYLDHPGLAEYFRPNWNMVPNLAIDLHVLLFGHFMPLAWYGLTFIIFTFMALLGGCLLLHRVVFGRNSLWPFLAVPLLFNRLLLYGLVNYLFACGLFLIALATWIGLRDRSAQVRAGVLAIEAFIIFVAHFYAFGLIGLSIGAYELACVLTRRNSLRVMVRHIAVAAVGFAPSLIVFAIFLPRSGLSHVDYHALWDRLTAFGVPILYDRQADTIGLAVIAATGVGILVFGRVKLASELLIVCVILFFAQLAMPDRIFSVQGADHRIPIAVLLILIAASDAAISARGGAIAFAAVLVGVTAARIREVDAWWRADDVVYAQVERALNALPDKSKVATAYPPGTFDTVTVRAIAIYYLPVWNLIPRGGFTQTLYAVPTKNPLVMQPAYAALADATDPGFLWDALTSYSTGTRSSATCAILAALQSYDAVILLSQQEPPAIAAPFLSPLAATSQMRLYQVSRTPPACAPASD